MHYFSKCIQHEQFWAHFWWVTLRGMTTFLDFDKNCYCHTQCSYHQHFGTYTSKNFVSSTLLLLLFSIYHKQCILFLPALLRYKWQASTLLKSLYYFEGKISIHCSLPLFSPWEESLKYSLFYGCKIGSWKRMTEEIRISWLTIGFQVNEWPVSQNSNLGSAPPSAWH